MGKALLIVSVNVAVSETHNQSKLHVYLLDSPAIDSVHCFYGSIYILSNGHDSGWLTMVALILPRLDCQ